MNIIVREAEFDDAHLIAEITRAAWADRVAATPGGDQETAERVLRDLREGGGFIMTRDEVPIGSVRWVPVESQSRIWEIQRMGVLPAHRGERLSQHLLEAVIHRALANEVEELRLEVRIDQDRLLDLYATFGFELAPELEYSYAPLSEPGPTVMRRILGY
jgi:ribosomal protein S18 acetylase RimI-like enzyme